MPQPPKKKDKHPLSNSELYKDEAAFQATKKQQETVRNTTRIKFGRNFERDSAAAADRIRQADAQVMEKASALGDTRRRQQPSTQRGTRKRGS